MRGSFKKPKLGNLVRLSFVNRIVSQDFLPLVIFMNFLKSSRSPQDSELLTVVFAIIVFKPLKYSTVLLKYKNNVPSYLFFPRGIALI